MLFREYEPRALTELARVRSLALQVSERFDAGVDANEILRDVMHLESAYDSLEQVLPTSVSKYTLARHLHFLRYYLERNETDNCRHDIKDMCRVDLPKLEQAIRTHIGGADQHDPEFAEKIGPLLRDQHLDSAIRRAFVIL